MPQTDSIRLQLQRLVRRASFEKFVMLLENGDRVVIEHPENVAFDPRPGGANDFYVLAGKVRLTARLTPLPASHETTAAMRPPNDRSVRQ